MKTTELVEEIDRQYRCMVVCKNREPKLIILDKKTFGLVYGDHGWEKDGTPCLAFPSGMIPVASIDTDIEVITMV